MNKHLQTRNDQINKMVETATQIMLHVLYNYEIVKWYDVDTRPMGGKYFLATKQ